MGDLGHVPGVLEQDGVGGDEADSPVGGALDDDVLDLVNNGLVIVMGLVHESGTQHVGVSGLHVIHDH